MSRRSSVPRIDSLGLDFSNFESITPEEIELFHKAYTSGQGAPQSGFDFLIDHNPSALKTYRYFATSIQPPWHDPRFQAPVFGGIGYYAHLGFDEGVRYQIVGAMRSGYSQSQIEEGLALSFMVGGPPTVASISRALKDFEWPEKDESSLNWPEGWAPDPKAFASGLDFSTLEVLPGEIEKAVGWYERTIGWVPDWVRYFAKFNPGALKGWRCRYEHAIVTLPNQILPLSLLFAGVLFERKETIRENVAVARAFNTSLDDVLQAIDVASVRGTEKASIAYEAAGDLLDEWDAAEN